MQNQQNASGDKKRHPGLGKYTSVNSTFTAHTYYTGKTKPVYGHSRGEVFTEPQDKVVMLEKWIIRLYKKGYWSPEKVKCIEWYANNVLEGHPELVMITYPDEYELGNCEKYVRNERLCAFLTRFYKAIRDKKVIDAFLCDKPMKFSNDAIFSLTGGRFKNSEELLKYTWQLTRDGHPEGRIMDFYRKYKEKFFTPTSN